MLCLFASVLQPINTGAGSVVGGVLCPVCKSCQLLQRQGLLVCPGEGWALNLAAESLSMDTIQTRLAAAYEVCVCDAGAESCGTTWVSVRVLCVQDAWFIGGCFDTCVFVFSLRCCCVQEHGASGCPGQLCFSIEDLFGPLSLTCSCSTCNSFAVVV